MTTTEMATIGIPIVSALLFIGAVFQRLVNLEKKVETLTDLRDLVVKIETKLDIFFTHDKNEKK